MLVNTIDFEVIADVIAPVQQGWTREVTVKTVGHKVRVHIRRDSYDFQSVIRVEVWSPANLQWNTVQSLSGKDHGDLPSSSILRHGTVGEAADKRRIFEATADLVDELIAYAQQVIA